MTRWSAAAVRLACRSMLARIAISIWASLAVIR